MPRRGENIRKRKDGRWEGRYINGYDPISRKAKYTSIYGKTYTEVKKKMDIVKFKASVNEETKIPHNKLFGAFVQEWYDNKKSSLKISSQNKYLHIIEKHILPELGHLKTCNISNEDLRNYVFSKKETGNLRDHRPLSDSSMKTIIYILKSVIKFCQKNNCMRQTIYIETYFRKDIPREVLVLTSNEQNILDNYLNNNKTLKNLGIMLSLYCGLRIGEICALRWQDMDLSGGMIYIRQTVQRIRNPDKSSSQKTILQADTPKSIASKRSIPIPDFLINYIMSNFLAGNADAYILNNSTKKPTDPRTMQYHFKKVLNDNEMRHVNYHVLRHTFATECISMGFDVKTLSQILGHSNINITLNKYVHPSLEQMKRMMNYWDDKKGQIYGQTE